jgi:hypothetical protein
MARLESKPVVVGSTYGAAFAALRLRRLVGVTGIEPVTPAV